jgi:uncharacterized protein
MKSNWRDEKRIVLDACALIAFLNDEPGAEIVAEILEHTPSVEISAINLLEIAYDAVRRSGTAQSINELLDVVNQLPIKIHWRIDNEIFKHAAIFKGTIENLVGNALRIERIS